MSEGTIPLPSSDDLEMDIATFYLNIQPTGSPMCREIPLATRLIFGMLIRRCHAAETERDRLRDLLRPVLGDEACPSCDGDATFDAGRNLPRINCSVCRGNGRCDRIDGMSLIEAAEFAVGVYAAAVTAASQVPALNAENVSLRAERDAAVERAAAMREAANESMVMCGCWERNRRLCCTCRPLDAAIRSIDDPEPAPE